jgi:hypothetical protein
VTTSSIPVLLAERASGKPVPAELRDVVDEEQIQDYLLRWRPEMQKLLVALQAKGVSPSEIPQNARWNWTTKIDMIAGSISHRAFCILCNGVAQALMRVELTMQRSKEPSQNGLNCVYVEYIEVAPWNLALPHCPPPRYTGSGSLLMRAAVQLSRAEGFGGRVALHSIPQAQGFYAAIGMTDLGPHPSYPQLHRFEFTTASANAFAPERSKP